MVAAVEGEEARGRQRDRRQWLATLRPRNHRAQTTHSSLHAVPLQRATAGCLPQPPQPQPQPPRQLRAAAISAMSPQHHRFPQSRLVCSNRVLPLMLRVMCHPRCQRRGHVGGGSTTKGTQMRMFVCDQQVSRRGRRHALGLGCGSFSSGSLCLCCLCFFGGFWRHIHQGWVWYSIFVQGFFFSYLSLSLPLFSLACFFPC